MYYPISRSAGGTPIIFNINIILVLKDDGRSNWLQSAISKGRGGKETWGGAQETSRTERATREGAQPTNNLQRVHLIQSQSSLATVESRRTLLVHHWQNTCSHWETLSSTIPTLDWLFNQTTRDLQLGLWLPTASRERCATVICCPYFTGGPWPAIHAPAN